MTKSNGEKIKLKLAELLQKQVNTLILDEPTNHIDIDTKEVFEEALDNFDGTMIFVSHDRYFINKFAEKIFEVNNMNVKVNHITTEEYKTRAKRPKNSKLSKKSLIENGFDLLPSYEDALIRYKEELENKNAKTLKKVR